MKKNKLLYLLVALLALSCLLTACAGGNTDTDGKDNSADMSDASGVGDDADAATQLNMRDVVEAIEQVAPVTMAQELAPDIEGSDMLMTDLFGIDLSQVEDYYGKTTQVNVSSDVILMVKAAPGQVSSVKAALEARRNAIAASFEMYLADQYDKASNGRVVVRGDYALLVIGGDSGRIQDGELEQVYAEIDEAIDTALQ